MNFSDACRQSSKNHRHVPFVHACVQERLARSPHTNATERARQRTRARQWSNVRSPVQRPGFTCARTKINCNQHRCINQIVRRVGSERRIGTVGTRQSSALPFGWFVDGTLYASRPARETRSHTRSLSASLSRNAADGWKKKGKRTAKKSFAISTKVFASLIRK